MTRNIPGNVPDPEDLYGRDALLDHLWRTIAANNILLLAPRRFGKTGVMRHVLKQPRHGYLPIYFDLEDVDSSDEFIWRVVREVLAQDRLRSLLQSARALPAAVRRWVKETFDEVEFDGARVKFREEIGGDWRTVGRRLMLELEKAGPTLIFIFDELPSMLDKVRHASNDGEARSFMAWFRSVRMQQQDELRRHRFLVGGSTGLDLILRRLSAPDTLNDFGRIYVEPLTRDEGVHLVNALARSSGIGLPAALVDPLLALIGPPVPYFIHLLFAELGQLPPQRRQSLTREVLEATYRERVLGPACKRYFDHYQTRLARYGGKPVERAAIAVLTTIAEAPLERVGATALYETYRRARGRAADEQEFDELLADLECDWYVVLDPTTNEYHFMLSVMRDWWRRWHGARRRTARPGSAS
jgi:uncharacterized protein